MKSIFFKAAIVVLLSFACIQSSDAYGYYHHHGYYGRGYYHGFYGPYYGGPRYYGPAYGYYGYYGPWIPAHWGFGPYGRVWIRGHYR